MARAVGCVAFGLPTGIALFLAVSVVMAYVGHPSFLHTKGL